MKQLIKPIELLSPQRFNEHISQEIVRDFHRRAEDNFDPDYMADFYKKNFNATNNAAYLRWFFNNSEALFAAYSMLDDAASKELFISLIRYRIAGHHHVKISTIDETYWRNKNSVAKHSSETSAFSHLSYKDAEIRRYQVDFHGHQLALNTLPQDLMLAYFQSEYFFEREGIRVAPETGDFVIDGGACNGEASVLFAAAAGPMGHVYAFDFVAEHIDVIECNKSENDLDIIETMAYALGDRDRDGSIKTNQGAVDPTSQVSDDILMRRIDTLVETNDIERIDFLKMDIEGSELLALEGAAKSIRHFHPKLAICVYHKPNHLFEVPLMIKAINPNYRFYLHCNGINGCETVLYGLPIK